MLQKGNGDALALAVWMANSSELLHFFSCDVDIVALSVDAQNVLAECVQHAFLLLVDTLQNKLHQAMPAFVSTSPDVDSAPGKQLCCDCCKAFCHRVCDTPGILLELFFILEIFWKFARTSRNFLAEFVCFILLRLTILVFQNMSVETLATVTVSDHWMTL